MFLKFVLSLWNFSISTVLSVPFNSLVQTKQLDSRNAYVHSSRTGITYQQLVTLPNKHTQKIRRKGKEDKRVKIQWKNQAQQTHPNKTFSLINVVYEVIKGRLMEMIWESFGENATLQFNKVILMLSWLECVCVFE